MSEDCCWNYKYYIASCDNELAFLGSAFSNVCVFPDTEDNVKETPKQDRGWEKSACPTSPSYICYRYKERFY